MKHAGGQVGGGGDRTRAREERDGGAGWCGEPRACAVVTKVVSDVSVLYYFP